MATPAAILSILVDTQTGKSSVALANYQKQLETANLHGVNLEKQSAKTGKAISSLQRPAEKTTHSLVGLAKGLLAVGGAFIAFEKAKEAITTTVELGHATERLSAVTGLDAKQASAWIETMKVRNVQTKQVALSFITLSRNIRNAQDGSKTAKKAFEELGISTKELATQSTQETLLSVADGLSKIRQPAERAAIAQSLFGRAAQGLIPVLVEGRKGVEDALGATEKYGAFLPKNVKNINQAIEAQRGLTLASDGLKIAFTTAVLPALVKVASAVLGFISQLRTGQGVGGQFAAIIGAAFQRVKDAVGVVVPIVAGLITQFRNGDPAIRAMAAGIAGLVVALKAAAVAQAALNVISEASPWVRAATLIAALVTALLVLQEKNKGVHDALENTWTSIRNVAQAVFPVVRDIAVRAFDIIVGAAHTLRDVFNAVFPVVATIVTAAFTIIKIQVELLKAVFQVAFDIIRPIVVNAFKAIKFAVENVGIPAFQAAEGPLNTLGNVFKTVFNGAKTVVKGAMDFILGAFADFLHVVADVAGVKLPFLGKVFGNASDSINTAADSVDNLKRQLDGLPAKKSTTVDVQVNFLSNVAGAIASIGATISNVGAKVGGSNTALGHRAVGGMVDQPMIMVGEEAPQHPEVILATNPAYRQRNLGLWAQAGGMLGIPGFAQGGLANAGAVVSKVDPWTAQHAGSWVKGKAGAWAQQFAAPSGGGGPVPAGTVRDWLRKALQITNHFSAGNLSALYGRTIQESGGRPGAINLWDSNAKAGHPSKGLLQMIDSTFNTYALPGLGDIWNPIANAAAAIRYMFAKYRHIVGPSSSGYRKGGIVGYATGGIPGHPELHGRISQIGEAVLSHFPGLSVSSTTGGTHASGSYHYKGEAVDLASSSYPLMDTAAGWVLSSGLFKSLVEGIHNPNLSVASGSTVPSSYWGATTWAQHANHIHLAAIGDAVAQAVTGSSGKPGSLPAKAPKTYPTSAVWGPQAGWVAQGDPKKKRLKDLLAWSHTWQAKLLGIPAPPTLGDAPDTVAGAGQIAGRIRAHQGVIDQLTGQASTLGSFYGIGNVQVLNDDGSINEQALLTSISHLDKTIELRKKVFREWQMVVALTQQLIAANKKIIARLQKGLASIKTKGLKGAQLKAAQTQIANTKSQIAQYQGNLGSAMTALTGASGSRDQSWIDLLTAQHDRATLIATKAQPTIAAGVPDASLGATVDNAPVTDSATIQALQTLLTQANQRTAVSQAQFGVLSALPFGGSFAQGGIVPGAIGSPSVIVAHGGERVSNGSGDIHLHFSPGTEWLKDFVQVEISQAGRSTSRTGRRALPGSTGR